MAREISILTCIVSIIITDTHINYVEQRDGLILANTYTIFRLIRILR
jgi:hypothetical protein